jgi:4-hydroxybenzoate polyprenyltransferase
VLVAVALVLAEADVPSWLGWAAFTLHLCWQVTRVNIRNGPLALGLFRSNWHAGLLLFAGILADALT